MDRSLGSPRARWKLPQKQSIDAPVDAINLTSRKAFLDDSRDSSPKRTNFKEKEAVDVTTAKIDIIQIENDAAQQNLNTEPLSP